MIEAIIIAGLAACLVGAGSAALYCGHKRKRADGRRDDGVSA